MLVIGIALGSMFNPMFYLWAMMIGVPLTIVPVTYRSLVGGGCSLRFQICALVKGMFAGIVFLMLTMITDTLLWPNLAPIIGWNPTSFSISDLFYQIWFFSGILGGMGARVVEVRGYTAGSEVTIAGFE
jgi:hypothetical protein